MALETDLNVPPYHDDYDPAKNYYRILYRPATAVQARELTQQQTMLQTQIERFGDHVFKDGSIVDGVGILYYPNVHFIAVEDTFSYANGSSANNIFPTSLTTNASIQYLLTNSQDSNNAVRAVVKIAKDGTKENANNTFRETNRFYLDYTFTGTDLDGNDVNRFAPGDTVYIYNQNQNKFGTLDANNLVYTVNALSSNSVFDAEGYAYLIGCSEGTVYQKGVFVNVDKQVITVRDFSTNVNSYVVGFDTLESIVDENEDESLLDNALGYPNENAPGAHRLKLTPTLVSKTRTDVANNKNFFAIVEFDGQEPVKQKETNEYAALEKYFANRTYEESGDYVVVPFQVETRVNSANNQSFLYEVSPGVGYVRGIRIETIGTSRVEAPRGIQTRVAQNQIVTANYGNYVICEEYLGQFDFEQISEVTLYDQPQNAISDYEGVTSSPSGTIVGYANIRAVVFDSGTRGLPTARYYVYLFNIRMDSGKNFSTDVKSIYTDGAFGKAKADIVLENGLAILKESTKTACYFATGLAAVKRLTNNTGIGDTSFIYNQIKSGTMAADGTVTITIDTVATGAASERLNSTSGTTITGSLLEDYQIYLSANAYTANLTNDISITSGGTTITGNNTLFGTELEANCNIRIYANSTQTYVRRVVSIASNTQLTVDAPLPQSNGSAKYQRFYVGGTPIPLQSVTINSNTSFTANTNIPTAAFDSGSQSVYCTYPVNRNEATSIPKVINKSRFVKIDCSNNVANTLGPWDLGFTDVHKIRNIYVGTSYANTNPERSDWFTLDTGQRDSIYDHGKIAIKPQYASQISGSTKLLVEVDFFTANTSASVGFFSVESYPIDDANTANTNAIQTIEIPRYNQIDLRNVIDFRPLKYNTANTTATAIADATINPAVSNSSFSVSGSGQYFIAPDTNFTADFEYYLPRRDLIVLDSKGTFNVKLGTPSETPVVPFVEADQSAVAECFVPAYPTATKREFELYGPNIASTRINLRTNRRYTMRDIGALEQRLKTVEYYTVLNVLEQQARDLTIPDANGLNRFKNGIFADPFNSHNNGNVTDFEYKIAIDQDEKVARPYFKKHNVDFKYLAANSTNTQQSGPIVTLPYTSTGYIRQRFATKIRNATEAQWQWNGLIDLYPSYDFFRNEQVTPNINVNIDSSTPWEQFAQSPFGTHFGDWRTISSRTTTQAIFSSTGIRFGQDDGLAPFVESTLYATTTTKNQQRTISNLVVNPLTENYNLGSYVRDVSVQPYMRSRLVAFITYSMKPNTTLHAFFDGVNVDAHCIPGVINPNVNVNSVQAGQENIIVNPAVNAKYGDALVSDANGFVCGLFRIPSDTFRVGDREFLLTNVNDLTIGADAQITKGKATYTADSLAVTRGSTTVGIKQPRLTHGTRTESQTTRCIESFTQENRYFPDPIAQSFSIDGLPPEVTGAFLTRVGVFFQSKDNNLGCNIYICEMENNVPNTNKLLGKSFLPPSSINTSTDGTVETIFTLEYPLYLIDKIDYCFIIHPEGNSPEYNVWVGETGGFDVATNEQVYSNPYSGLMFVSANFKTWSAIQKEDIKFNLYRARFTQTSGTAVFKNEDDEFISVDGFTRANSSLGIDVGDIVYTVNSAANTANVASIIANTLSSKVYGRIQYFDEAEGTLWLDSSTANSSSYFSNTTNKTIAIYRTPDPANSTYIVANNLISYANIVSVDNLKYHTVVPKFGVIEPARTKLEFSFAGTSNTNIKDVAYVGTINEYDYQYYDYERHAMSRSNEINSLSSNKSGEFRVDLTTTNDLVSPVINLSRKSMLFVENKINNDSTNEHLRTGNAETKYVSKKVVLADGQEAEDLNLYLTAYRPTDTEIEVYAKFWNNQDAQPFDDKVWTKLQYADGGEFVYGSQTNTSDYREYKFTVPSTNAVPYGAFANTGFDIYNPLGGGVSIQSSNTAITAKQHTFNANTDVNGTNETIAIANANTYFKVGDPIIYNVAAGNTAVSGLSANVTYYVSFANTTRIAVASTRTGANIDLTASSTSETGHWFTGTFFLQDFTVGDRIRVVADDYFAIRTITSISNNTYMTVDTGLEQTNTAAVYYVFQQSPNDGIVEYTNSDNSRFIGFKEFAIKIVLLSSNPVRVPKLNDVRCIALQI
jgi:hypothetical protein